MAYYILNSINRYIQCSTLQDSLEEHPVSKNLTEVYPKGLDEFIRHSSNKTEENYERGDWQSPRRNTGKAGQYYRATSRIWMKDGFHK